MTPEFHFLVRGHSPSILLMSYGTRFNFGSSKTKCKYFQIMRHSVRYPIIKVLCPQLIFIKLKSMTFYTVHLPSCSQHLLLKHHIEHAIGTVGLKQLHYMGMLQHMAYTGLPLQVYKYITIHKVIKVHPYKKYILTFGV